MKANRYHIAVTLEATVEVEADTPEEADGMVSDAVHEAGYGDLQIAGTKIVETIVGGPAKYRAWLDAWAHYHKMLDAHGIESPETAAARAAIPKDMGA